MLFEKDLELSFEIEVFRGLLFIKVEDNEMCYFKKMTTKKLRIKVIMLFFIRILKS